MGGEGTVTFSDKNDIIEYLIRVYRESVDYNNGNRGGAILDTYMQLPFFSNVTHFLDVKLQGDIKRYIYAKDTGTPPYSGGYGDTPNIWMDKYFIIKSIINEHEGREIKKRGKQ
ncbi:hypothetical protein CMI37_18665 [Candidatus Pacearchaeota archaeon]|nr:hypothetical protein [Candidatus Pacearchaeota archaeon]|tara:strand:+ start:4817 stop:5158 length:342 start_codon:yes stop_codon:yes gene_type:complete